MKRVDGSQKSTTVSDNDEEKCRERRRLRMASVSAAGAVIRGEEKLINNSCAPVIKTTDSSVSATPAAAIMNLRSILETPEHPVYGTLSVIGRQRVMEDEVSIRANFCQPEINGFRPVHFFGLFDGHGGEHVSALCREHMHVIMREELMRVKVDDDDSNGGGGGDVDQLWRSAVNRSFQRMDEMALRLCLCGPDHVSSSSDISLSLIGSTAVVSLLTMEYMFVANCGDSRAVLYRDGKPIPVSVDHKPDRYDERARIEACGGRITLSNGAQVEGILALSRAIGVSVLKQWVTSEPEISITKREAGDEFLILASDGLWDVLSTELACHIVHECLQTNRNPCVEPRTEAHEEVCGEGPLPSKSESAATLLVRVALGRKSADNISVIVIDLK